MRPQNLSQRPESFPGSALPPEVEVTLLFCDVARSTELTRRLGDCGAYQVIRGFHDVVLRASAAYEGEELELRGDGVLLAFQSPRQALACAGEIQRQLLRSRREERVSVRIGLHCGSALRVAGGYFGANVILSARVAAAAAPGQILASATLVQRLASPELRVDAGRWAWLKGIPEPTLVFSVPWRSGPAPVEEPRCPSPAHEALLLALDRTREAASGDDDEASCMLGRSGLV